MVEREKTARLPANAIRFEMALPILETLCVKRPQIHSCRAFVSLFISRNPVLKRDPRKLPPSLNPKRPLFFIIDRSAVNFIQFVKSRIFSVFC